jgi:hypothetical protein
MFSNKSEELLQKVIELLLINLADLERLDIIKEISDHRRNKLYVFQRCSIYSILMAFSSVRIKSRHPPASKTFRLFQNSAF